MHTKSAPKGRPIYTFTIYLAAGFRRVGPRPAYWRTSNQGLRGKGLRSYCRRGV